MKISDIAVSSSLRVIETGLWIIRYFDGGPSKTPPAVVLNPSPIGKGSIDFFPGEGVTRNTLTKPGDCIIARVKGAPASLLVSELHPIGQQAQVKLRIDKVDTSFANNSGTHTQASAPNSANTAAPLPDALNKLNQLKNLVGGQSINIKMVGHIERRGDVVVHNDWLGAPDSTQRIEGFSISCDGLPEGVTLGYSCRSNQQATPQVALANNFVGSRRQAKPITAVAFNLGGPKAADFTLNGNVVFAGQQPLAIIGGKELSGPSGQEPLVAMRLNITAKQRTAPASPWDDPAITEIFTAR